MTEVDLTHMIETHPDRGILEVACVKAFCMKESSFREWAHKPEEHYQWLVKSWLMSGSVTELWGQRQSWGLMQVMGATAREYGFKGDFLSELCDPYLGLKYGMIHLRTLLKRHHGVWQDVIASYNAGSPRKDASGKYGNQAYVDAVLGYWAQYDTSGAPLKESEA